MNVFLHQQEAKTASQRKKRFMRRLRLVQQVSYILFAWLLGMAALYGGYVVLFRQDLFPLKQVVVEGNLQHLNGDHIRKLAQVQEGINLFRINMFEVQQRLSREPWVAEVTVRRKLPGTLWLFVTERKPVALMVDEGMQYMDAMGATFPVSTGAIEEVPVLTGFAKSSPEERQLAMALIETYQSEPISDMLGLSEVHLDPAQGYSIVAGSQAVQLRLGWGDFSEKLKRLGMAWSAVSARDAHPSYVDATVAGKVIAKYGL